MSSEKKTKRSGPYQMRLDEKKIKAAKEKGIDIPGLFRDVLDRALQGDVCPTCKQKIKRNSRLRG